MRRVLFGFMIVLFCAVIAAAECGIADPEKIAVGSYNGIRGRCANNGLPVTCIMMEGTGIECDGPAGGYTGRELAPLIFTACGCSAQKENELQQEKQLDP